MKYGVAYAALILAIFHWSSCNESIEIGGEILPDEDIVLEHVEFVGLNGSIVLNDSLNVYLSTSPQSNFILGELGDPYFGMTKADLICMPRLPFSSGVYLIPDFESANTLDSAVLILPVSNTNLYGDTTASHSITVHKVTDDLRDRTSINNSEKFNFDNTVIGQLNRYVYNPDSMLIYNPVSDTSILERAQIRIPLNADFASQLIADPSIYSSTDTSFLDFLPGLYVRSESQGSSLLSIDLGTLNQSRMRVYYTESDTARIFDYLITGAYIDPQPRFNSITTDIAGAPVEAAINDTTKTDDFIYVRGMADGFQTILDFTPIIQEYREVALNLAEVEITLIDEGADTILYPAIEEFTLEYLNADGFFLPVPEASVNITTAGDRLLDGKYETITQEDGTMTRTYKLILTNTIQQVISGELPAELYLKSRLELQSPRRSVMYGTNNDQYPIKIKVSYSVTN